MALLVERLLPFFELLVAQYFPYVLDNEAAFRNVVSSEETKALLLGDELYLQGALDASLHHPVLTSFLGATAVGVALEVHVPGSALAVWGLALGVGRALALLFGVVDGEFVEGLSRIGEAEEVEVVLFIVE